LAFYLGDFRKRSAGPAVRPRDANQADAILPFVGSSFLAIRVKARSMAALSSARTYAHAAFPGLKASDGEKKGRLPIH
jgi:hypothetical protein